MLKNNSHKSVIIWLLTGCALIFLMVVIGGITRLTESGLSMVDWKLFMGMIPPLSEQDWLETFNQYKQFPEYREVNFMFTLEEFKSIFFWEYLHRLIGRIVGLVFIIPFVYFLLTKKITGKLSRQSIVILFMGAFQGFLGWWMVKSGLIDNPDVSHYRLAAHLIAAFLTFAYTFWVALSLIYKDEERPNVPFMRKWIMVLFVATVIQIIYGAFVAGLNAGFVMNTYPKMGDSWIAESVTAMEPFWINFIDGIGGVQFVHRTLAHIVVGLVLFLLLKSSKFEMNKIQTNSLIALLVIVFVQFMLGVFTLLYAVPVWLGVTHQVGAFFLLGTVVYALSSFRKV
jgi:cytochrome c oxidase assembly protein subunit 15|tara:strand:+ start:175 stop:1197 length:1023 start_codon:yes stop_codon:yes gene_type:complete